MFHLAVGKDAHLFNFIVNGDVLFVFDVMVLQYVWLLGAVVLGPLYLYKTTLAFIIHGWSCTNAKDWWVKRNQHLLTLMSITVEESHDVFPDKYLLILSRGDCYARIHFEGFFTPLNLILFSNTELGVATIYTPYTSKGEGIGPMRIPLRFWQKDDLILPYVKEVLL